MTDPKICPHDRFTATSDKKFMECNECSRSFSTDLYWGVYDQLEYGKDQGCGEEAIEVIQMVEDHHEEQRREQMSNHQHPKDETIARKLIELGKTPDCTCDVEYEDLRPRWDVKLDYDLSCPVHFPNTSTIIGWKRRT